MKRVLVIWFFVAALVAMGCSPPPDSFGSVGTLDDSWVEIWDWYDLDAVRNDLSGSYILMTDLNSTTAGYEELAGSTANAGSGWQPIATSHDHFTGTLDGQGGEIGGLFISRPSESCVGLFSYVGEEGIIKDLSVVNVDVTGEQHVGGLAGINWGVISAASSSGRVVGDVNVGGLVGYNPGIISSSCSAAKLVGLSAVGGLIGWNYGVVTNSCCEGSVDGVTNVGGLVGYNPGSISGCYSTSSVKGSQHVGGLAGGSVGTISSSYSVTEVTGSYRVGGLVGGNAGNVSNCYAIGNALGDSYVGGLIGYDFGGSVSKCYSACSATGSSAVGGLLGAFSDSSVSDSFWDVEASGTEWSPAGTGKTTAEMKDIATFLDADWDIGTTALGDPTGGYPFLSWQVGNSPTWLLYGGTPPAPPPSCVVGWETSPVNKLAVLAPWITLLAVIVAGASLLMLRRRRAQI